MVRRNKVFFKVILIFLCVFFAGIFSASYIEAACPAAMTGDGASGNPCMITNCTQLQAMDDGLTLNYSLNNSINCSDTINWDSGAGFNPIGNYGGTTFSGSLDGRNYTISNFYINRPSTRCIALIIPNSNYPIIKNLGLVNVNITGQQSTGGISCEGNANLSRVFVTGTIHSTYAWVGGLGGCVQGWISDSYSTAKVLCDGQYETGGLVGTCSPIISNSYATGNVSSTQKVAGFISAATDVNVSNSFSTGSVTGSTGGFMYGGSQIKLIIYIGMIGRGIVQQIVIPGEIRDAQRLIVQLVVEFHIFIIRIMLQCPTGILMGFGAKGLMIFQY